MHFLDGVTSTRVQVLVTVVWMYILEITNERTLNGWRLATQKQTGWTHLPSSTGQVRSPEPSRLARGPSSAVRLCPGWSVASREWAWTSTRPRDWGHTATGTLNQWQDQPLLLNMLRKKTWFYHWWLSFSSNHLIFKIPYSKVTPYINRYLFHKVGY